MRAGLGFCRWDVGWVAGDGLVLDDFDAGLTFRGEGFNQVAPSWAGWFFRGIVVSGVPQFPR